MRASATVIDLGPAKPTPTKDRVSRRKEVLKLWEAQGVPADKMDSLPTSLRQCAKWEDPSLGIEPIGSPNQFTKTHTEWGEDVAIIDRLQRALQARSAPVQRKKSTTAANDKLRQDLHEMGFLLESVISQWQMAREQLNDVKASLAVKDKEISTLKKTNASLNSDLRAVKHQSKRESPLREVET